MHGRLTIFFVDRPATRFYLNESASYTLGRDPDCEIRLDDRRVSRRHARFEYSSGAWRCANLSSKNGIRVNGRSAGPHELQNGAWLDLGGVFACFETVSTAAVRVANEERRRRREVSVEITRRLDAANGLQTLLNDVLGSVLELSGTQRGFVMLANDRADFDMAAMRQLGQEMLSDAAFSGSLRAVRRAVEIAHPVVVCDAAAATGFAGQPSIVAGGIRALICLPLQMNGSVGGVIYADSSRPGMVFDELDMEILAEFASRAAVAISAAAVRKDIDAIARMLRTAEQDQPRTYASEPAPLTLGELLRVHAVE